MGSSLRYEQISCMRGWRSKNLSFVYYTKVYCTEKPCFTVLYKNWSGLIDGPVPERRFVHNAHARCYIFHNANAAIFIHQYMHQDRNPSSPLPQSIASSVLPPCPPSLLPPRTLKLLLAQLPIDLIMRLAHPPPQPRPSFNPRLVPPFPHPLLEILCACPARIQTRK